MTAKDWHESALGFEERWRIEVLPYEPSSPPHPEFEKFVRALAEAYVNPLDTARTWALNQTSD